MYNDKFPSGCDTCEDMERDGLKSMRQDFVFQNDWALQKRFFESKK